MKDHETQLLITVGVTCFNAEKTIERAIFSAQTQEWPELEILVVDDCSTDGSCERIQKFVDADSRIRLIEHTVNAGPGAARQTLLTHAKGVFIVFFDDDDESAPERVSVQYSKLINTEKEYDARLGACYASGRRSYPNGYEMDLPAIGSQPKLPRGELVADFLLYGDSVEGFFFGTGIPTCALMARTEVLREVGGFDVTLRRVEDADLAVRLALAGGWFVGCPERLFTQYSTQGSDKSALANYRAELMLLEKHKDFLERRKRYSFARRWFTLRYHHFRGAHFHAFVSLTVTWFFHPFLVTPKLFGTIPRRILHERKAFSNQ